ncbi:BTAD domain-containing putative transcriptional regulator [Streptomyces sp. NPDC014733]|uniref:AfsR/SARP family transcriptional regulator n=1 Tax=Streptomyces sp. NPDC014733 TaxID=3364885 RepID=UPI0036FF5BFF
MTVDIRVLGPLRVSTAGGEVAPSAPKPRQLLALLATRPDETVSMDALVDELWDSRPPSSVITAVQTYIVLLRRQLTRALGIAGAVVARDVLPFEGWGYRLATGGGTHDAQEFRRCATAGRRALAAGEDGRAAVLLRRALGMWHGPVLADVKAGPQLTAHRTTLAEDRLTALEQRIEADLRLGHHHELLGELTGLTLQYPLHENLHALFMISLYRAGRPAQALSSFQLLRRNLREELGIDPSPRMWRLQQAVLTADESLQPRVASRLFPMEL